MTDQTKNEYKTENLNNMVDKFELTDIYIIVNPRTAKNTFFSSMHIIILILTISGP